ncbi:MAG TPA: hypothetical protein VGT44_11060 [Ktedonobacteraceae bacterium]|nr:hypothetical protein [Ktedonobacteraceae bacterium]
MESLAFSFPLKADKTEEWRAWIGEILGPRRSQYEVFVRSVHDAHASHNQGEAFDSRKPGA